MRRLIIVPRRNPTPEYAEDFETIARSVRVAAPDIEVRVHWDTLESLEAESKMAARAPTLTVSIRQLPPGLALPGRVMACRAISKLEQQARYQRNWVPSPPSVPFAWGTRLDPNQWGPFVIIKTLDPKLTSQGGVLWLPTPLLHMLRPEHFAERHWMRVAPSLVQRFVNTGRYPSVFRVLMFLGVPLYAMSVALRQPRPRLSGSIDDIIAANIASNGGARTRTMIDDTEILDFARQASFSLPDVPLQGIDVIREHGTGKLFALESNPGGNTWHFSSEYAAAMREEMGDGRKILLEQFGALDRAAAALVKSARAYAA